MKKQITMVLVLSTIVLGTCIGQTKEKGYILYPAEDTLYGQLKVTIEKHLIFIQEGKSQKIKKKALRDYGYLEDGKSHSLYAATAFKRKTRPGLIVRGQRDTFPIYLFRQNSSAIAYYDQEHKKYKKVPGDIKHFAMQRKDGNWAWFDNVAVPINRGLLRSDKKQKFTDIEVIFAERLVEGKVNLYTAGSVRESSSSDPNFNVLYEKPHHSKKRLDVGGVYILRRGREVQVFEKGALNLEFKSRLKAFLSDAPTLVEKIGTKGYQFKDMYQIILEYNEFFAQIEPSKN